MPCRPPSAGLARPFPEWLALRAPFAGDVSAVVTVPPAPVGGPNTLTVPGTRPTPQPSRSPPDASFRRSPSSAARPGHGLVTGPSRVLKRDRDPVAEERFGAKEAPASGELTRAREALARRTRSPADERPAQRRQAPARRPRNGMNGGRHRRVLWRWRPAHLAPPREPTDKPRARGGSSHWRRRRPTRFRQFVNEGEPAGRPSV